MTVAGGKALLSFEYLCNATADFIGADELAEIILSCWKLPQRICVRDIVVMPTSSDFG
ncbi:hypothetical protein [Streptomyces sp. NPDC005407]|uniref:hypothetical protein n=1 Tax=Streptomyces sp. NPDC005407 TaxID=3155340 RepID=UPI0033BC4130